MELNKSPKWCRVILLVVSSLILHSCFSEGVKEATVNKEPEIVAEPIKKAGDSLTAQPQVFGWKDGSDELFSAFSPDGQKMLYQRKKGDDNWQIWLYDVKLDSASLFYLANGNVETPRFSPDGLSVVFTGDMSGTIYGEELKSRDLYLLENSSKVPKKITDSKSDNWAPSFSSDGTKLFFTSNRNDSEQKYYDEKAQSFVYNIADGKITELLPMIEYKNGLVVSPDQQLAVFTNSDNRLEMVELKSGNSSRLLSLEGGWAGGAFFSEDGTKVYFHYYKDQSYQIMVYDIATDLSSVVIDKLKNCRSPFVKGTMLYFHSNQSGKYNIYKKELAITVK